MEKAALRGAVLRSVFLTEYYSGDQIKKNEMRRACGTYQRLERCVQNFGWEARGKKPLGRPRRRWEDNIKMNIQEIVWAWS